MSKNKYGFTKSKKGILTVGQLVKALEGLDANTQVVVGDSDGWYNNIEGFHTPNGDDFPSFIFVQGNPVD